MPNFIVGVITNLQSLNAELTDTGQFIVGWYFHAEWIFMVAHCDSASNIGWDALYHTAYLRERLLAKVRLTLQKYNAVQLTRSFLSKLILVWKYVMEYGRKFWYGMEYGMEDF